jgi:hypothetical protein
MRRATYRAICRNESLNTRRVVVPTALIPGFASFLLPIALMFFGSGVSSWRETTLVVSGLFGLLVTLALQIPRHLLLARKG